MKRAIVAGAVIASLALAGPASAATPTERKLQREVNTLKREVATLKRQMRETQQVAAAGIVLSACVAAVSADAFQSTWTVLDQKAGGPVVGPQQTVNDAGTCTALEVARSQAVPPTLAPFHSVLRLLAFRSLFGSSF
jgi:hypothetical protein